MNRIPKEKIIDFHAHIYPEKIAEKASESIGKFYNAPMLYHGFPEELIESGSKVGVVKYVIHSVATKPEQVEAVNDFIIDSCKRHSEFIGFATHHQDYKDFDKELDRIQKAGLKGIKMHPDFQKFQVDMAQMDNFYTSLEERNFPILLHAGDCRFDFSGSLRLSRVLNKHPKLKIIAAHFGGYTDWENSLKYLAKRNIWFDTSSSLWKLPLDKANEIIRVHGADKFLFGSDFPMWNHEGELERFNKLCFTKEERSAVLYNNAVKLLDLKNL
ncbi:MAG: amidohydrolase family protein [Treponema sp.]|jgi:predicted TIM-barrel fold metal-dependent hydrolase|nr:amidohydrolase family protein [Treponema sp.]